MVYGIRTILFSLLKVLLVQVFGLSIAARNRRRSQRQAWRQGCSTGLRDLARSPAPPGLEAGTPCQTKRDWVPRPEHPVGGWKPQVRLIRVTQDCWCHQDSNINIGRKKS